MIQRQKDKYTGYGISIVVHVLIFTAICFTGLFAKVSSDAPYNIDVDIYEIAQDTGGGGGGGSTDSPAMEAEAGTDDIAFSVENEKLPEIAEEYTKEPEKQQQYRQEHNAMEAAQKLDRAVNGNTEYAAATPGQGTGSGTGTGNGQGAGTGNGAGEGSGSGTGNGNGSGNGDGTGSGDGRDEEAAKVAKVPPVFLGGRNPVYPQDLQDQGIGGTVVLRLTVSSSGTVTDVDIAGSSGISQLDRAAVQAAYSYSFAPARNVYDEPVACIMNKKVVFVP